MGFHHVLSERQIKNIIFLKYNKLKFFFGGLLRPRKWKHFDRPGLFGKPDIMVVHHFACTGGSLIVKAIRDSMNVSPVSEVNPAWMFGSSVFKPGDVFGQYSQSTGCYQWSLERAKAVYQSSVQEVFAHCRASGRQLLLRDWTHGDFFDDIFPHVLSTRDWLPSELRAASLLTVRHPIESYVSARSNNIEAINRISLDEYCFRYLYFLRCYPDASIMRYEDFCLHPSVQLQALSDLFSLSCRTDGVSLSDIGISGDSGRRSNRPQLRPSKAGLVEAADPPRATKNYIKLCDLLGYSVDLKAGSTCYLDGSHEPSDGLFRVRKTWRS